MLYLKGRDLSGLTCHEIAYNNAANVDANCNFAPVFDVKLEGTHEVIIVMSILHEILIYEQNVDNKNHHYYDGSHS